MSSSWSDLGHCLFPPCSPAPSLDREGAKVTPPSLWGKGFLAWVSPQLLTVATAKPEGHSLPPPPKPQVAKFRNGSPRVLFLGWDHSRSTAEVH